MPTLQLSKPVDPITVATIKAIADAATQTSIRFLLVGAMARQILLENLHGLKPARATVDVDIACALQSWGEFDAIKARLVASGQFKIKKDIAHRLTHMVTINGRTCETDVDLIPFGGVENQQGQIAWPPEHAIIMNVGGFREALNCALEVEIDDGLVISVGSLAALALLKLHAWIDRGDPRSQNKDALDLATLMMSYEAAGNADRVYDEAESILASVGFDTGLAAAWLLGLDTARIASVSSRNQILGLLTDEQRFTTLVSAMAGVSRDDDYSAGAMARRLSLFRDGFADLGTSRNRPADPS